MTKSTSLVALALLALSLTAGCRLVGSSTDVGRECSGSSDCDTDGNDLGCVLVDEDGPGASKVCMPPPDGWACQGSFYGDGDAEFCDCGCGIKDQDCPDLLASSCNSESGNQCPAGQNPVANDNTRCQ